MSPILKRSLLLFLMGHSTHARIAHRQAQARRRQSTALHLLHLTLSCYVRS